MLKYTTIDEFKKRYTGNASDDAIETMLEDAELLVDAYAVRAELSAKAMVVYRMVVRALGTSDDSSIPIGASQGTMSALGYSQTWTMSSNGSNGELYLTRTEKKLLGCGDRIGSHSPLEDM